MSKFKTSYNDSEQLEHQTFASHTIPSFESIPQHPQPTKSTLKTYCLIISLFCMFTLLIYQLITVSSPMYSPQTQNNSISSKHNISSNNSLLIKTTQKIGEDNNSNILGLESKQQYITQKQNNYTQHQRIRQDPLPFEQYYGKIINTIQSITLAFPSSNHAKLCPYHFLKNGSKVAEQTLQLIPFYENQAKKVIIQFHSSEQFEFETFQQIISQQYEGVRVEYRQFSIRTDYLFIRNSLQQCSHLLYSPYLQIRNLLSHLNQLISHDNSLDQSPFLYLYSTQNQSSLSNTDISNIAVEEFNNYLFVIKKQVFRLITPLNFAFNNLYTFQQLILYPTIALFQGTQFLKEIKKQGFQRATHSDQSIAMSPQFQILQQNLSVHHHICFVATPSLPTSNNITQLIQYFSMLPELIEDDQISFVITIKYPFENDISDFIKRALQISKIISVRVRIRYQHIQTGLEIYEAGYTYCPQNSAIFSSRFNIIPTYQHILNEVKKQNLCYLEQKSISSDKTSDKKIIKMIIPNYIKPNKQQSRLEPVALNTKRQKNQYYYENHLINGQLFCSHLVRESVLEDFKWKQTQFYETQYAFAMKFLQSCRNIHTVSESPLFQIQSIRQQTDKERMQIQGLMFRNFGKVSSSQSHILPIKYNSLNNRGLKRNAPDIIPKILHQIWLIDDPRIQLSPVRKQLTQTLIDTNPDFKYMLWKKQNITKENFPFTYQTLIKLMKKNEKLGNNFYAVISDIMRIEILYHHGGIYTDLKTEGRKSLTPFLKYIQFFFDVGYKNAEEKGGRLVNGIIGSIPHHTRFKTILIDYFNPNNITLPVGRHIYESAGATRLVLAYDPKQLVVDVLNFGPFLAGNSLRPCLNEQLSLKFDETQKVFEGYNQKHKKYKIGVPCKVNTQKYLEMYRSLGRSYFSNKPYKLI